VRHAEVDDAAEIAAVHVRSWQGAYRGLLSDEYLDSLDPAHWLTSWQDHLALSDWSHRVLVAETETAIVGFLRICPTRDPDSDPRDVGEVTSIYVLPEFWGMGVGQRLIAAGYDALADAGFQRATLWVLTGNSRAIRFYHASGWHADGTSKDLRIDDQSVTELRFVRDLAQVTS
jgi:ribosomal protein S18 acetylase RimI-like enzyme